MTNTKDQIKAILAAVIIVAAVLVLVILRSLDFTPGNDITATGNTAGNLYNGGFFCEYEEDIYFSWPGDDHRVYCMKPDGTLNRTNITDAFSINICNGYLYYGRNGAKGESRSFLDGRPFGVYRVSLKSGRSKALCPSLAAYVCLSGNDLFLQEYTDTSYYFTRVNIKDANDIERISSVGYPISCAENGYLYYAEQVGNHNIYRYDTRTGNASLFYEGNCFQPVYDNGLLYYIDLADGYALKCYDTATGQLTVIIQDRCINYNVSGSVVFYQIENPDTGHFGLYRNNTTGTAPELITNMSCRYINIAGDYAYFQYFTDTYTFYRVGLTGPAQITQFQPDVLNAE